MTTFRTLALVAAPLLALAAPAAAATVVIDFDALDGQVPVDEFYSGVGVHFVGFTTASGFGETSQPNLGYNGSDPASASTDFGFTSLSFTAGFFDEGTLSVYSGAGGTGVLLGSLSGVLGDPAAFAPYSVAFSGVAHSFTLAGPSGNLGLDDITFGTVPEPMTWSLMITGFGLTGAAMRRRKAALAA